MQGLESLLGTDLDGPPRDLDVSLCLGITCGPLIVWQHAREDKK